MPSLTPSRIVLRHSNVSGEKPVDSDLLLGEIFINIPDNKLYYKNRDAINPIIEIDLTTSTDLINVRDVDLNSEGVLVARYSDNTSKALGNVVGPAGRGLAIDGVVDYVNQLPNSSTIANVLNKNGTLFIVREGLNSATPLVKFSPVGPRIYSYSTASSGTWTELTGATVAASGLNGTNGTTIISGILETPPESSQDGDYYLDRINYVLFGPKSAGVWPEEGVNLKGIQGPPGPAGPEILKPYLYNKHLAETVVPAYWQYDGWNYVYGPGNTGYEVTIFPDGLEELVIDGDFVLPLTQNSYYGYDPLPFSLNSIITATSNPADKPTIDAIIETIGNCTTMLDYPASFVRLLDLASANFSNGGCFFSEPIQATIEKMLDSGWTIDWPFDGITVDPYITIENWPSYNSLSPGNFYSQSNGVLYFSTSTPTILTEMTPVPNIGVFPYRNYVNNLYFTSYDLQMTSDPTDIKRQYYYYDPA